MSRIDDLIQESLSKEDEALLAQHGSEPGFLRQVRGMFSGPLSWVMWLVMGVQVLLFAGAVYAFWMLFTADDVMSTLRWGVVAIVLVQLVTFLRGFMGAHLEANRILRAVNRVELRQVRQDAEHG
jgi:hypothetical protein